MAKPTLVVALLLIAVGVGGYFSAHPDPVTGKVSVTALIPAFFGIALGILGAISFCEKARKHAMHLAAVVGLLGLIGDGMQLMKAVRDTGAAPDVRQLKILSMSATLVLLAIFLALCIRSFATARRNRLAGQ